MHEFPNDRERAALLRIADALMKAPADPADAEGNRVAFALERIALWCELANEIWEPVRKIEN